MVSFCGWVQLSQGYRATNRRQFTFYHSDKSSSPQLHPNFMISLSQFPIIEKKSTKLLYNQAARSSFSIPKEFEFSLN